MPTYLVTYHGGGGVPPTPEAQEQVKAAFGQWLASVGDAVIDPGAPLGASKTVSSNRAGDGSAAGSIGGYTLLRAADLDRAAALLETHPFVARGGTLRVSEAVDLGS